MLKFLQKSLPALAIAGALSASAQDVVENFQTWPEKNVKMPTAPPPFNGGTTAEDQYGTCDKDNATGTESGGHGLVNAPIPAISQTVPYGSISVKYDIVNGAIVPKCLPKSAYNSASSPSPDREYNTAVSRGYIELQKLTGATDVFGTFITSAFDKVESIYITVSATGTGKPFSVATSIDGGSTWTPAGDGTYSSDKTGNLFNVPIQLSNVQIRIASTIEVIRLHDFQVYFTPLSIKEGEWYSLGAKVRSENNNVFVSASYNGQVEIINVNGTVVGQTNLTAGVESTVNVPAAGMYVVRLATASKTATTKIIVQ